MKETSNNFHYHCWEYFAWAGLSQLYLGFLQYATLGGCQSLRIPGESSKNICSHPLSTIVASTDLAVLCWKAFGCQGHLCKTCFPIKSDFYLILWSAMCLQARWSAASSLWVHPSIIWLSLPEAWRQEDGWGLRSSAIVSFFSLSPQDLMGKWPDVPRRQHGSGCYGKRCIWKLFGWGFLVPLTPHESVRWDSTIPFIAPSSPTPLASPISSPISEHPSWSYLVPGKARWVFHRCRNGLILLHTYIPSYL